MKDLWFRVLVIWYRLTGSTPTQAQWRARQTMEQPARTGEAVRSHVRRAADERFQCVCGQLLVAGDKVCSRCGRRQLLPYPVRRAMRTLGLVVPDAVPGTLFVLFLMMVGYLAQIYASGGNVIRPFGEGAHPLELGAAIWTEVYPAISVEAQPWRAFTYTMLHGNLMHLLFNTFALMQVGPLVENRFGTARFLFAWVVGAMAAVFLPPLVGLQRDVLVVGASGSIFGLIGMALVRGHLDGGARGRFIRDVMVRWIVYATLFGFFIGGVAHAAHFGGLAAGALCAVALPPADDHPGRRRLSPLLGTLAIGAMVASIAGFLDFRFG